MIAIIDKTPFHRRGKSGLMFAGLHPLLQQTHDKAGLIGFDHHIIQGYRDPVAQLAAYKAGLSKAKPGQSPHNFNPALGDDWIPYPFLPLDPHADKDTAAGDPWHNIPAFRGGAHVFIGAGHILGIPITWGGDWDGDGDEHDQSLFDGDHIELTNWRQMK